MNKTEVQQKLSNELKIQGKSPKTIKMYWFYNEKFLDFIKKDPDAIITEDVKTYLAYLISEQHYDAASVSLARSALKYFYDGLLGKKIVSDIKTPKKQRKLPDVPTKEEIRQLIDSTKKLRNKLLIEFMYSSGLRVSECAKLKKSDLNIEENTGLLKSGKGGKDRFFILSTTLVVHLKEYLEKRDNDSEYIFPGPKGYISTRNIQRIISNSAKKSGIKKNIYCHLLRHAFATHLLEAGVDIRKIQELLAHSNLQTTQWYTQVSTKELRKVKSPLDSI